MDWAESLAANVIIAGYRELFSKNIKDITDAALFFSDRCEDSMLVWWLGVAGGKSALGSHRLKLCNEIGDKARSACIIADKKAKEYIRRNKPQFKGMKYQQIQHRYNKKWLEIYHKNLALEKLNFDIVERKWTGS